MNETKPVIEFTVNGKTFSGMFTPLMLYLDVLFTVDV